MKIEITACEYSEDFVFLYSDKFPIDHAAGIHRIPLWRKQAEVLLEGSGICLPEHGSMVIVYAELTIGKVDDE